MHWLKDGERNTKFFHALASQRKRRNAIHSLTNVNANLVEDQEGKCEVAKEYFSTLFSGGHCTYDIYLLWRNSGWPFFKCTLINPRDLKVSMQHFIR